MPRRPAPAASVRRAGAGADVDQLQERVEQRAIDEQLDEPRAARPDGFADHAFADGWRSVGGVRAGGARHPRAPAPAGVAKAQAHARAHVAAPGETEQVRVVRERDRVGPRRELAQALPVERGRRRGERGERTGRRGEPCAQRAAGGEDQRAAR
jgi:hypothetical protein